MPSLFKRPIKLDHRSSRSSIRIARLRLFRFHACVAGLHFGSAPSWLASFHLAAENCTIFYGQPLRTHFAGDPTGIPQLHALRAVNLSVYVPTNYDFPGGDIGFDLAVGTNRARGVAEIEFALECAIHKQILFAGDFTFDADPLRDASGGAGRNGKRRTYGGYRSAARSTWLRDCSCAGRHHRFCDALRLRVFFPPHSTPRQGQLDFRSRRSSRAGGRRDLRNFKIVQHLLDVKQNETKTLPDWKPT